eukprot:UN17627
MDSQHYLEKFNVAGTCSLLRSIFSSACTEISLFGRLANIFNGCVGNICLTPNLGKTSRERCAFPVRGKSFQHDGG